MGENIKSAGQVAYEAMIKPGLRLGWQLASWKNLPAERKRVWDEIAERAGYDNVVFLNVEAQQ